MMFGGTVDFFYILTICILIDFPQCIDTKGMELSVVNNTRNTYIWVKILLNIVVR